MKLITKPRKKDVSESNIKFEGLNRKDQIFKKPARLQRRNQKERGKFDKGKEGKSLWEKYSDFNDSAASIPLKFLDPTGISSWKDVYDSWTAEDLYIPKAVFETVGAIPLIGKIAKLGKAAKLLSKDKQLFKVQDYLFRGIGTSQDIAEEMEKYNFGKNDSVVKNTIAYNQWRQSLPSNLQNETLDYDLYGAFQAGLQPQYNEGDGSYHLGSRDPETGKILKKINHPTFSKAIYSDMELGYYPIYKDGEIYTEQPLKYKHGKDSGIHIKKANRGKFTAAAKRAGMGVQEYARKILSAPKGKYSSTLRKRANFARNASKFNH